MTDSRDQNSVRRPVIVTAILLVAAAVTLVALWSSRDRAVGEIGIAEQEFVPTEAESVQPVFEPEPTAEPVVDLPPSPAPAATPVPIAAPIVPLSVILLPARAASDDPEAVSVAEAVRQSALRALRAMPNMQVIEISPAELAGIVPANAGSLSADNLVYLAVTRRYGARVVAEISEESADDNILPMWMLNLRVRRPNGGGGSGTSIGRTGDPRWGDVESVGIRFAERIASDAARVANESNPAPASDAGTDDARSVLLDATRSEQERLRSLSQLLNEGLDSGALAAAADLAMRSASSETRQRVLMMLRRSAYDPSLAQLFSIALLSDIDVAVRKEAALGLGAYVDDAAASAALDHAARSDSSAEVRLAARMAAMDFDEQQALKRETLLDRSLTPAERLAPTMVGDGMRNFMALDRNGGSAEEQLAYAEIVVATEDPELKLRGLSGLQPMLSPVRFGQADPDEAAIVDVLIESSQHSDERVRERALQVLVSRTQMSGNERGRAVLESVLENEPDLAARLRIASALESADQNAEALNR